MPLQKLLPEDDRIIFEGTRDPNTRPKQIVRFMVEYKCSQTTINNGIRRHKKRLRKEKMAVASKAHRQRKTREAVGVGAADEAHDNDGNEENQGVPPVADGIAGPPVPQAVEGFKPASPALPPPPKPQPTLKPLYFEANTSNTSLPAGNLQTNTRNYKLKREDWKKIYEGTRDPATFEEDVLRFAKEYKVHEITIKRSIGYEELEEEQKLKDELERQMADSQAEEMETEEATPEDVENVADQPDAPLPSKNDVPLAPPRLFLGATSTKKFLPNSLYLNP